ncbi:MAG: DUF6029 family protein [Tannerellaceae bacterium]|jgi:hypothetical protein|nr:DUF6029 family protein [Tannerellaceae bacterium]
MKPSFIDIRCVCFLFLLLPLGALSQERNSLPFSLTGNIRSDILFPEKDAVIGAKAYEEIALTNSYASLNMVSKYVDAGTRFAYLDHPLPGFEPDFAGWGLPYLYVSGKYKKAQLTIGDFYEQFGSGLIFRTYEERNLGIDNSLRGARLLYAPYQGIHLKALGGKQRRYWEHNNGYVWGMDMELDINQWVKKMEESNTFLMFGSSFVSKHEADEIILISASERLRLPRNVGAFDMRTRLQKGNYTFLAEYAIKANDPSKDNQYSYRNGYAILLSGSYSQSGLGILLQAKRSDNMSFRSKRSQLLNSSFINHLPAFTMQHTYALAALYPYATQPNGEWAFQGSLAYGFKRTIVKLNASHIRGLNKERYYQDININIDRRFTKDFRMNLMYMNQYFNQFVIQGHGNIIKSNIFIAEGKYQINKKLSLRSELQYLNTKEDEGDWFCGLMEVSLLPYFMFTVSDIYNAGATDTHYYKAQVTYTWKAHFMQVGYGRTKAGYDCSGGVCREVPASKGLMLSYNYNF